MVASRSFRDRRPCSTASSPRSGRNSTSPSAQISPATSLQGPQGLQARSRSKRAGALRARFDRIFKRETGCILLDRLLARLHQRKAERLRVLDRPEIPLRTNGSENDIRSWVTKRKISGGTVSNAGKAARDAMLGLLKTRAKLNVSFYRFLGDRFGVLGSSPIPSLPLLVNLGRRLKRPESAPVTAPGPWLDLPTDAGRLRRSTWPGAARPPPGSNGRSPGDP